MRNFDHTSIKKLRRDLKLSQRAFAKALGVPQMTIYRWEKGKSLPNVDHLATMYKLASEKGTLPMFFKRLNAEKDLERPSESPSTNITSHVDDSENNIPTPTKEDANGKENLEDSQKSYRKSASTHYRFLANISDDDDIDYSTWENYKTHADSNTRDKLLRKYTPLVTSVANRMKQGNPDSLTIGQMVNVGVIGLIEALNSYDPNKEIKFETYAIPRIRGSILDELKELKWMPGSKNIEERRIERAMTNLESDFSLSSPRIDISMIRGNVSSEKLLSLDELICSMDSTKQALETESKDLDVFDDLELSELRSFLISAISTLTQHERFVVSLYYYEELALKEIGEIMLISESRVSQIHTRAITKLRAMIRDKFAI